ncbi:MAG: hypothetical protein ACR2IH_04385 [Pyrinomonadaceae bacterium]
MRSVVADATRTSFYTRPWRKRHGYIQFAATRHGHDKLRFAGAPGGVVGGDEGKRFAYNGGISIFILMM